MTSTTEAAYELCTGGIPTSRGVDAIACSGLYTAQVCSVSCLGGFNGSAAEYRCSGNGSFVPLGPPVECTRIECDEAGLPEGYPVLSFTSAGPTHAVGEFALVGCPDGFRLDSLPGFYLCKASGVFDGTPPACAPVECNDATLPIRPGVNTADCLGLHAGGSCALTCEAGYTAVGGNSSNYTCDLQGHFSGHVPTCDPARCELPPELSLPQYRHQCSSVSFGEACIVECGEGYSGRAVVATCGAGLPAMTGGLPDCVGQPCTRNLPYGEGVNASSCAGTRTGESCTPVCGAGYLARVPAEAVTCQPDGAFADSSLRCQRGTCGDAAGVAGFGNPPVDTSCQDIPHGEACFGWCAQGYQGPTANYFPELRCDYAEVPADEGYVNATTGGALTPPACVGLPCTQMVPDARGVTSDCAGRATGKTCDVYKLPGFEYVGGSGATALTCEDTGAFAGPVPEVAPMACPTPALGDGVASTCGSRHYGERCWAYCMAGFSGKPREYECALGGAGGGVEIRPVGEAVNCESQARRRLGASAVPRRRLGGPCAHAELVGRVANSPGLATDCGAAAEGENCIVECAAGHSLAAGGPAAYRCGAGGALGRLSASGPELPACAPNPCNYSLPQGRGVKHNCTGQVVGESCVAECDEGYAYEEGAGPEAYTCQADGEFRGTMPRCAAKQCAAIEFGRGYVTTCSSAFTTHETCVVDCAAGFTRQGPPQTWACLPSGVMSGSLPACSASVCSRYPDGSDVDVSECYSRRTFEECEVSCGPGYNGTPATMVCGQSGIIEGAKPTCVARTCPATVPKGAGLVDTCGSVSLGDSCTLGCAAGHAPAEGAATREWSCEYDDQAGDLRLGGDAISCQAGHCEYNLPVGDEFLHNCSHVATNGQCAVQCAPGYIGAGVALQCHANGSLSDTRPACAKLECPPRSAPRARVFCEGGRALGSTCFAACEAGYLGDAAEWRCALDESNTSVSLQGPAPRCAPNPCYADMPAGERLEHDCLGVAVNETCQVRCSGTSPGQPGGSPSTLRCRGDGTFEGDLPVCAGSPLDTATATTPAPPGKDRPGPASMSGTIVLAVSGRALFVADGSVKSAIRRAIAAVANVTVDAVSIELTLARRLSERMLQDNGIVQVGYEIVLPLGADAVDTFEQIKAEFIELSLNLPEASSMFSAAVSSSGTGESYSVSVTNIAEPVLAAASSTTAAGPSQVPPEAATEQTGIATGHVAVIIILSFLASAALVAGVAVAFRRRTRGRLGGGGGTSVDLEDSIIEGFMAV